MHEVTGAVQGQSPASSLLLALYSHALTPGLEANRIDPLRACRGLGPLTAGCRTKSAEPGDEVESGAEPGSPPQPTEDSGCVDSECSLHEDCDSLQDEAANKSAGQLRVS
jgi:hypothetical protein